MICLDSSAKDFAEKMRPLCERPGYPPEIEVQVAEILNNVRAKGDAAIVEYALKFDKVQLKPENFRVTDEEIKEASKSGNADDIWAVESSNIPALSYANVGLMCGVKTFNSTAVYPNTKMWEQIDPNGENNYVYNRFSHIGIYIKEAGEPEFELVTPDSFKVYITFDELLPLAEEYGEHHLSIAGLIAGMMVMALTLVFA